MGNRASYSRCGAGFFRVDPGFQLRQLEEYLGNHQKECCAAKYKSVSRKVKPMNIPMPISINPPLTRPPLSRDPYLTPLTPNPPEFIPTRKVTEERLKLINFGPPGFLKPAELNLFKYLITKREKSLAFDETERGLLKHTYGKPYVIPVAPHEPWQIRPIPIPGPIKNNFIELVRERIRTGLYEPSTSSYSSPIFCVKKQDGRLRIVHDLQKLNQVTIKDAGLPPSPEDLIQSFTGYACYGLGEIMGRYDERELAPES